MQGRFISFFKGVFWGVFLDRNLFRFFILKQRSQPQVLRGQWNARVFSLPTVMQGLSLNISSLCN